MSKYCPQCGAIVAFEAQQYADAIVVLGDCNPCGWRGSPDEALPEPLLREPAPKLKYVSIDIETTGLDPDTCQVIEFGAVIEDWTRPVDHLPVFRRLLRHKQYVGEPFALAMNADLLRQLANPANSFTCCSPEALGPEFAAWLIRHGIDPKRFNVGGKNFASFDAQFLKRLPNFSQHVTLHHRTIDPAMLLWQLDDEKLPDSKTCMERAGIEGGVAHTAVEDAIAVVKIIRYAVSQK